LVSRDIKRIGVVPLRSRRGGLGCVVRDEVEALQWSGTGYLLPSGCQTGREEIGRRRRRRRKQVVEEGEEANLTR
jgi:hypothetical protein